MLCPVAPRLVIVIVTVVKYNHNLWGRSFGYSDVDLGGWKGYLGERGS